MLESLLCNSCGAPLEVPDSANSEYQRAERHYHQLRSKFTPGDD